VSCGVEFVSKLVAEEEVVAWVGLIEDEEGRDVELGLKLLAKPVGRKVGDVPTPPTPTPPVFPDEPEPSKLLNC
jgi:hypothetical protein